MSWTPDQIGDLSGRTAIVTGANSGLGEVTAATLAEHGARVVLAVRNVPAGRAAAARMPGDVTVRPLDLASLASVREFADSTEHPVDLLVNNAGIMATPRHETTADGFERQFGVNHLGHFALTALLLPRLLAGTDARVVTIASLAHKRGDAGVLRGNPAKGYRPDRAYGNSKLANLLFALEFHRRATAAGAPLVSAAAHPGVAATNLATSRSGMGAIPVVGRVASIVQPHVFPSAKSGAQASLYAATHAAPGSYTGPQQLFESRGQIGPATMSRYAADPDLAARLWELSEEWTGVPFEV